MVNPTTSDGGSGSNDQNQQVPSQPQLSYEQRIAWQAQTLQMAAEQMAILQNIISVQASLLKGDIHEANAKHQKDPAIQPLPPVNKEKLLAMQDQVLKEAALRRNSQNCQGKDQVGILKGPVKRQVAEAWKIMKSNASDKSHGIQESCQCCRHYGFPCLLNKSSKGKAKIDQNLQNDVDKRRKSALQEPQLGSSQHLSPTALPVPIQSSSQKGPNIDDLQVSRDITASQEICLDEWSITYKEFQPRKRKQASNVRQAMVSPQNQQVSNNLAPHDTLLQRAEPDQGNSSGKPASKACFHCREEGHYMACCPKKYPSLYGNNRGTKTQILTSSGGAIGNQTLVQESHQPVPSNISITEQRSQGHNSGRL